MAQNAGSHHMNVFRQNTVLPPDPMNPNVGLKGPNADGTGVVVSRNGMGACFYSPNWADWPLVVNSQQDNGEDKFEMKLPDKVGHKIMPGEILMLQTHYVNATTQKTPGTARVYVNFHRMADETNAMELGTLFATKQSISICKDNPVVDFTGFCKFNNANTPVTIVGANAHFHSRGKNFDMYTWDGQSTDGKAGTKFYTSTSWDEPPMMTYPQVNLEVPQGAGVAYNCAFEWAPSPACQDGCSCLGDAANCCYKFGGIVEKSEHCNIFVYYYPKINRTDINCF